MSFLKSVGGFLKKAAPVIGGVIGTAVGGPAGGMIGSALGGAVAGKPKTAAGPQQSTPFAVDKTAFGESDRQKQLYDTINTRMGTIDQRQAPTVEGATIGPDLTGEATTTGPTQRADVALTDVNKLGLSDGKGFTAGEIERAASQGVDLAALGGAAAQGVGAGAGSATAATIDQTRSDESRNFQMNLLNRLQGETEGIGSDALTRALRQSTDRGIAAQAALANSARGNASLNQRNAANAMARTSQAGQAAALDAFANERAQARALLGSTAAQTRGVDADLAAQQAGFQNAVEMANAQNQTQASIATSNNMTNANISNADNMGRALMQNAELGSRASLANAEAFNRNQQFNATQQQQAALNRDDLLARIGLSNTGAQNESNLQFANLNQQNQQFNAGQANSLQQQLLGLNNQRQINQAQLGQQANLANQAAQLQQMGMNDQQIQYMLGLQNNMNQFGQSSQQDLQRLLSGNYNTQAGLNAQVAQQNQQRSDSIIGKIGQGITTLGTQYLANRAGGPPAR